MTRVKPIKIHCRRCKDPPLATKLAPWMREMFANLPIRLSYRNVKCLGSTVNEGIAEGKTETRMTSMHWRTLEIICGILCIIILSPASSNHAYNCRN